MTTSLLLQYCIIVLAALVSTGVVMRKQFPQATRRLRMACALPLLREGRPTWMQGAGRFIAPRPEAGSSDCGGCTGCSPKR